MEKIQINGHGLTVTPAIEKHITDKLGKLEKFFSNITKVHVILKQDGHEFIAEAELHAPGTNGNLFAKANGADLYQAIDELEKKLAVIIKKHHDKLKAL